MTGYGYASYQGQRVQVLQRGIMHRIDCRACGGDGWLDHDGAGGDCEYCNGTGKEDKCVEFAKIGWLEGEQRGRISEVRAGALA